MATHTYEIRDKKKVYSTVKFTDQEYKKWVMNKISKDLYDKGYDEISPRRKKYIHDNYENFAFMKGL